MNTVGLSGSKILSTNGKYYFWALEINGLFELDEKTGEVWQIGYAQDYSVYEQELYRDIQLWNNKLYGIPYAALKISVYDLMSSSMEMLELSEKKSEKYAYITSFIANNCLYMLPEYGRKVCILNLESGINKIYQRPITDQNVHFKRSIVVNGYAYIVAWDDSTIFKMDLSTDKIKKIQPDISCKGFQDIVYYNHSFFLLSRQGGVLFCWDGENTAFLRKYQIADDEKEVLFSKILVCDDSIYVLPALYDKCVMYKVKEEQMVYYSIKNKYIKPKGWNFSNGIVLNNKAYGISNCRKSLVSMDESQSEIEIWCDNLENAVGNWNVSGLREPRESLVISLNMFLGFIYETNVKQYAKKYEDAGRRIYTYLREEA